MGIMEGLAISRGIAMGPVCRLQSESGPPPMQTVADMAAERARADAAIETAKRQVMALYHSALRSAGAQMAAIFEIHKMMLEDQHFLDNIHGIIETESLNAEYAVYLTGQQFANVFAVIGDAYMRERAADIIDLSRRVVDILMGRKPVVMQGRQPAVVVAEELFPSQTVQLDKSRVLAFVSQKGSGMGHAAILARGLKIPAVSGLGTGFAKLKDGAFVIVDGEEGTVILDPGEDTIAQYRMKQAALEDAHRLLKALHGLPAQTLDGATIALHANISDAGEVHSALEHDAEGIGLFRSEYLYLAGSEAPGEDEQYEAYKMALSAMAPHPVVVRTLDVGADKQADYLKLPEEDNPALGFRAIRICLAQPQLFAAQLRALLRASVHGKLCILFPMVSHVHQLKAALKAVAEAKAALLQEGQAVAEGIRLGVMVETPAAAVMVDQLAPLVDFISIGTNDLTQYTYAVDRTNALVRPLFTPGGTAILRMVQHVVHTTHRHGIPVGICGESAADPQLLPHYIAMGVDELSMAPHSILHTKQAVRALKKADCIAALETALG
ncbi:MAG: phosphoenolpyruvate--protein phosphotransferase [Oscillospiraceae bacterium]